MEDRQLEGILRRLGSGAPEPAWEEFLEACSPLVLQVVQLFERDPDPVGDCFLFVCERLRVNGFRRLRRFRPDGPASFSTWLRAVLRNLCLDWHRRESGRHRVFRAVGALGPLERAVFRCRFREGLTRQETLLSLRSRFPNLTEPQLLASEERVRDSLTPRQLWLLSRPPRAVHLALESEDGTERPLRDPEPGPEEAASLSEQREALERALLRLAESDRLLVRLRFEEGLTLEQIARVAGLGNAQRAERHINGLLERLRAAVGGRS
jgi:DNA-directed RNA polymerase specialized sigma24 family protein